MDTLQRVILSNSPGDTLELEGDTQPLPRGQDTLGVHLLGDILEAPRRGTLVPLQLDIQGLHQGVDTQGEPQDRVTLGVPQLVITLEPHRDRDTKEPPLLVVTPAPRPRVDTDRRGDTVEDRSLGECHWPGCRT